MLFSKAMWYLTAALGAVGLGVYSTGEEDVTKAIIYALVLVAGLIMAQEGD